MSKKLLCALCVGALFACSAAPDEGSEARTDQALIEISNFCFTALCPTGTTCNPKTKSCDPSRLDARCTISGDPPLTEGCAEGEQCRLYACTNSIPPTCVGFCAAGALRYPQ